MSIRKSFLSFDSDKMKAVCQSASKEIESVLNGKKRSDERTKLAVKVIRDFIKLRQSEVHLAKSLVKAHRQAKKYVKDLKGSS